MNNKKRHSIDRLTIGTRRLIFSLIEKLFARLPSHSDSERYVDDELYVDDHQEISEEEFKKRFDHLFNIDVEDGDNEEKPKRNFATLEQFGLDLVAEARNGTFKAIVGREEEVLLLIETLCRRTKRNPITLIQRIYP